MKVKRKLFIIGLAASSHIITIANSAFAAGGCADKKEFRSAISGKCLSSYEDWINEVWTWSLGILVGLSTLVLSAAAFLYLTSGGNPDRVKLAKKLLFGVLSGIATLILARVLLVNVIGIGTGWNIK